MKVKRMAIRAPAVPADARKNTKVNDMPSLMCWDISKMKFWRDTLTGMVAMGFMASTASMASMVWMAQTSTDGEVPLVPLVVASSEDQWRPMAESSGVDGWLGGVDTEGTDLEVPLFPQRRI